MNLRWLRRSILNDEKEFRHNLNNVARLKHKVALLPVHFRLQFKGTIHVESTGNNTNSSIYSPLARERRPRRPGTDSTRDGKSPKQVLGI